MHPAEPHRRDGRQRQGPRVCRDQPDPPRLPRRAGAGDNARRLAVIAAATVLCGELSLLAAQTNPGELMRAHVHLERANNKIEV
ncbi:hypothetical protein ACFQV2_20350 [Actinokineospora soli]|uniref:Uncharacterized protein n=1 Tax=Actinokineospora soli TaxID=1048753 RepID=A0ABW2TSH6_9PSEU